MVGVEGARGDPLGKDRVQQFSGPGPPLEQKFDRQRLKLRRQFGVLRQHDIGDLWFIPLT